MNVARQSGPTRSLGEWVGVIRSTLTRLAPWATDCHCAAARKREESIMLKVGDKAPVFSLPSDSGGKVGLEDFKGATVVLFFFPKADTPG